MSFPVDKQMKTYFTTFDKKYANGPKLPVQQKSGMQTNWNQSYKRQNVKIIFFP